MPRCKTCNNYMKTDAKNQRYVCEYCGYVMPWMTTPGKFRPDIEPAIY